MIDLLFDEQVIFGFGIGVVYNGLLLIFEIQFLVYVYNVIDQFCGEVVLLFFFLNGQYMNFMVVCIVGFGYQCGFGGYFYNENMVVVLCDILGVIFVCLLNGYDVILMLCESVWLV